MAEEKTKQQLAAKKAKDQEIADELNPDEANEEFAGEFPYHPPEKGMNKRQQRQKKQ